MPEPPSWLSHETSGFPKLVRDRIPELIRATGRDPSIHRASDKEYPQLLRQKLVEEVDEFISSSKVEELVDIQEVIFSLVELLGIGAEDFRAMVEEKAESRGTFSRRTVLNRLPPE